MKVSVIVIGDELLIGQVVDTNSGFFARTLAPVGWEVNDVQTVADAPDAILQAIERAFDSSDVVLATGGLGPTKDDITKGVLCHRFGGELVLDESVLANVERIMTSRGRTMNELTRTQALVPSSCRVVPNEVGTAPGMWFETTAGKVLVSMPGVPFETQRMFTQYVMPQLLERFGSHEVVIHRTVLAYGISESALAQRLDEFERTMPTALHLAYLPAFGVVRLRLDAHGTDREAIESLADEWYGRLKDIVGENLIGAGVQTVEEQLFRSLESTDSTIATAESCTGGNIARVITSMPGISQWMLGGVVAYSNDVKHKVLGVSADDIARHGAVSREVVEQMAAGVCRLTGARVGIATSGVAGPGGGTPDKPVGTVWMAVCVDGICTAACRHFAGDRSRVVDQATVAAMVMAIKALG